MAKGGKMAVVPRLRFPEFRESDEWGVDTLAGVAEFVNEKVTLSGVSTANYVSTENLLPDYGGVVAATKLPTVSAVTRYRVGDTLISNIRPYLKKVWHANRDGGASNDVVVVRPKAVLSSLFLASVLKSDAFIGYVMDSAKGVKMPRGDVESMRQYPVAYPREREQQKIADCLSSLDELIAVQGRKVEALNTYKRGLMQQLFPREGETLPRLRFPEFRDAPEWCKTPLGDLVDLLSGYPFDGTDIVEDKAGIPLMRGINVTEGSVRHSRDIDRYYLGPLDGLEKYRLKKNDLVIGMDGSKVGKNSALISEVDADSLLIQRVARLRATSVSAIRFIFQQIHSPRFHAYVDRINTSSGIPHISAKQIKEYPIHSTGEGEQQRVAEFLSFVDTQIVAETDKLTALKAHKKGLMQQLFPSLEEAPQ